MNSCTDTMVYKAQLWRCITPLVITGLLIYLAILAGKGGGGSLDNYYYFSIIVGLLGLIITLLILKSNVVIADGKLRHRNLLGHTTKNIDLNSLEKAYVYLGWWPRWGNVLRLVDKNGNKIRLFLGGRIYGVLDGPIIPNFHNTKDLLNTVESYSTKSGIKLKR